MTMGNIREIQTRRAEVNYLVRKCPLFGKIVPVGTSRLQQEISVRHPQ